ncbi:Clu domain-containing protein [Balamuthia mandrillaris]
MEPAYEDVYSLCNSASSSSNNNNRNTNTRQQEEEEEEEATPVQTEEISYFTLDSLQRETCSSFSSSSAPSGTNVKKFTGNASSGGGGGLDKNWNERFQRILDMPEDNAESFLLKHEQLRSLAHDFETTAKRYGKLIIAETFLGDKEKTIRPSSSIGGQAGGQKFLYHGILFKYALDWQNIYGGDDNAMKAAGHELKGLINMYSVRAKGVCFPLMALVDYRGFRLIALSKLPIGDETVIYGSGDGGRAVHNSDVSFASKMQFIGQQLNLKEHMAGFRTYRNLFFPCDIEGHRGTDNRYYVVDFARVFPPEPPLAGLKSAYLFRLLRPELVKGNKQPLSSDAFSNFGRHQKEVNNAEVTEAYRRLIGVIIPSFSSWLDQQPISKPNIRDLISNLHRQGINVRYLGKVRSLLRNAEWRQVLLEEMIARMVSILLKAQMRAEMQAQKTLTEEPFKLIAISTLGCVFDGLLTSKDVHQFWYVRIKSLLLEKFLVESLSKEEQEERYNLRSGIELYRLAKRIQAISGVRLARRALAQLKERPDSFELVYSDVKKLSVKVKSTNIMLVAEAVSLSAQALLKPPSDSRSRLRALSASLFERALSLTPSSEYTLMAYGDSMAKHAIGATARQRLHFYSEAIRLYKRAGNVALPRIWNVASALTEIKGLLTHQSHIQFRLFELAEDGFNTVVLSYSEKEQKPLGEIYPDLLVLWPLSLSYKAISLYRWQGEAAAQQIRTVLARLVEVFRFCTENQPESLLDWPKEWLLSQTCTPEHIYAIVSLFSRQNGGPIELEAPALPFQSTNEHSLHEIISHCTTRSPLSAVNLQRSQNYNPNNISSSFLLSLLRHKEEETSKKPQHFSSLRKLRVASQVLSDKHLLALSKEQQRMLTDIKVTDWPFYALQDKRTSWFHRMTSTNSQRKVCCYCWKEMSRKNEEGIGISDDGINALAESCSALRKFSLIKSKAVTDRSLRNLFEKARKIEHINLRGCCQLTDAALRPLYPFSSSSPHPSSSSPLLPHSPSPPLHSPPIPPSPSAPPFPSPARLSSSPSSFSSSQSFLRALKLRGCHQISSQAICSIISRCHPKRLAKVDLSQCRNIEDVVVQTIAKHCGSAFVSLKLNGCCNITDNAFLDDASFSQHETEGEKVKEKDESSSPPAPLSFVSSTIRFLKVLHLSRCEKLSESALQQLFSNSAPQLKEVDLSYLPNLTDRVILSLSLMNNSNKLQRLTMHAATKLTDDAPWNVFSQKCNMMKKLVITDATLLRSPSIHLPRLRLLSLNGCMGLSPQALENIITPCEDLTELYLNSCQLTDAALHRIASSCDGIANLSLSCNRFLFDLNLHLCCLQMLDLSYCERIEDDSLNALLKRSPYLRLLNIVGCPQLRQPSLYSLHLQHLALELEESSFEVILRCCTELKSLRLQQFPSLSDNTLLSLGRSPLSSSLQTLEIIECNRIGGTGLTNMLSLCPSLKFLHFSSAKEAKGKAKEGENETDACFFAEGFKHSALQCIKLELPAAALLSLLATSPSFSSLPETIRQCPSLLKVVLAIQHEEREEEETTQEHASVKAQLELFLDQFAHSFSSSVHVALL